MTHKISTAAEIQMHQWLDLVQDNLEDIENQVDSMTTLEDLNITAIRESIQKQYRLLQVLGEVAQGKKILVGTRQKYYKSAE